MWRFVMYYIQKRRKGSSIHDEGGGERRDFSQNGSTTDLPPKVKIERDLSDMLMLCLFG